jgi:hypothetical protein
VSEAGIIIGMHGSHLMHIFHMTIGKPNCCALIEIVPIDEKNRVSFHTIQIFGNLAGHLGVHYLRHDADYENDRLIENSGMQLDVPQLVEKVKLAVEMVIFNSSCYLSPELFQ